MLPHNYIPEGETCPRCMRRVPKKKKPGSPVTKVVSIRVPIDDAETFQELMEAAARHAGLHSKAHWQFWTVHRGLVRVLQDPPETDGD